MRKPDREFRLSPVQKQLFRFIRRANGAPVPPERLTRHLARKLPDNRPLTSGALTSQVNRINAKSARLTTDGQPVTLIAMPGSTRGPCSGYADGLFAYLQSLQQKKS